MKWVINATTGLFQIRVNGLVAPYGNVCRRILTTSLGVWTSLHLLGYRIAAWRGWWPPVRLCVYLADLASAAAADVSDFLGDAAVTIMR